MTDVEDLVRRTFQAVADATDVGDAEPLLGAAPVLARRRHPGLLIAAAVVTVALVGTAVVAQRREDRVAVTSSPVTVVPIPAAVDLEHGAGVFTQPDGLGPDALARSYIASRFESSAGDVTLVPAVVDGFEATVRWSTYAASGKLLLGQSTRDAVGLDQWQVKVATTDTVDVGTVAHVDGQVRGLVRAASPERLVVDVVGFNDKPLAEREGRNQVALDVPVGSAMVQVQARLVDRGRPLSITEFRLTPTKPTEYHEIAKGSWRGGSWRLLGSGDVEHPSANELQCLQVELDGRPDFTGCSGDGSLPKRFVTLGRKKRVGDNVLEFGQLGPDVVRLVIRIPGQDDVVVHTVADPIRPNKQRLALFELPAVQHAEVEAFDDQGRSLGSASFNPTTSQMPLKLAEASPARG